MQFPIHFLLVAILPILGGKKETHFLSLPVDQFSKFQKISNTMDPQNQSSSREILDISCAYICSKKLQFQILIFTSYPADEEINYPDLVSSDKNAIFNSLEKSMQENFLRFSFK